jgi:hypothetical protein
MHARKERIEGFEKLSRERKNKEKKYVYGKERKKEKNYK